MMLASFETLAVVSVDNGHVRTELRKLHLEVTRIESVEALTDDRCLVRMYSAREHVICMSELDFRQRCVETFKRVHLRQELTN